jgi:hypothetical protein
MGGGLDRDLAVRISFEECGGFEGGLWKEIWCKEIGVGGGGGTSFITSAQEPLDLFQAAE